MRLPYVVIPHETRQDKKAKKPTALLKRYSNTGPFLLPMPNF